MMKFKKITAEKLTDKIETARVMYNADPVNYKLWDEIRKLHDDVVEYVHGTEKFRIYKEQNSISDEFTYANAAQLLKYNPDYVMMYGQRSNGKSTTIAILLVLYYAITGKGCVMVKRVKESFRPSNKGVKIFNFFEFYDLFSIIFNGRFTNVKYKTKEWWLYRTDENGLEIKDTKPFCVGMALNKQEDDKGGQMAFDYDNIFFDEFIPMDKYYLPNETELWANLFLTFARSRGNVKIFMAANGYDIFCPYFDLYGITNPDGLELGVPYVYKIDDDKNSDEGVMVVQRSEANEIVKIKSAKFLNVKDPNIKALFNGDFNYKITPTPPEKNITKDDVVFRFYIHISRNPVMRLASEEDNDFFEYQGDVIKKDNYNFIMIKPIAKWRVIDYDKELIVTNRTDGRRNWKTGLRRPDCEVMKRITKLFATDKVFYCDNRTAQIIKDKLLNI